MKRDIRAELENRILVLDGAMGTMLQRFKFTEEDFRGVEFKEHPSPLKGNNDLLSLTQPEAIYKVHCDYLEAGADIIETNTFSATSIGMADYGLESEVYRLNVASAAIAKRAAEAYTLKNPSKPRFVAGSIGPTNKTASMSPDVNDPGYRAITFDQLVTAYSEQVRGLIEGGADLLLIETIFDTLNAKAALYATQEVLDDLALDLPIMISGTITDASGRTLSGQTVEAFLISLQHANLLSIGLNCALGAYQLLSYIRRLSSQADCYISAHPNAGLPNAFGQYDQGADEMGSLIEKYLKDGFVNIIGGCCGSTPEHIAKIAHLAANYSPRTLNPATHEL